MITCRPIVQSVQDNAELLIETDAVVRGKDAVMIRFDLNIGIEAKRTLTCNFCLRFANVLLVEEELAIQVADIDCVQIDLCI